MLDTEGTRGMQKILVMLLMAAMLLSGCGVMKNLEKPGLSEIAKPKFGGDTYVPAEGQFWAKWGDDICAATVMTVLLGLLEIDNYFYGPKSIINAGRSTRSTIKGAPNQK
jgi:uncharacterized protein YceK